RSCETIVSVRKQATTSANAQSIACFHFGLGPSGARAFTLLNVTVPGFLRKGRGLAARAGPPVTRRQGTASIYKEGSVTHEGCDRRNTSQGGARDVTH